MYPGPSQPRGRSAPCNAMEAPPVEAMEPEPEPEPETYEPPQWDHELAAERARVQELRAAARRFAAKEPPALPIAEHSGWLSVGTPRAARDWERRFVTLQGAALCMREHECVSSCLPACLPAPAAGRRRSLFSFVTVGHTMGGLTAADCQRCACRLAESVRERGRRNSAGMLVPSLWKTDAVHREITPPAVLAQARFEPGTLTVDGAQLRWTAAVEEDDAAPPLIVASPLQVHTQSPGACGF